jgi:hypothetical protein
MPARKSDHNWTFAGASRDRCSTCRCIRSDDGSGTFVYCQIGGDPRTSDPGCMVALPGAIGVPFVDGVE